MDLNALGVFQIAGVTADLEIPITLSEKDGAYRLLSRGNFELNIRSLKRQKNAFNLEREITQLLALAPGINMRETVQVIMNMELVDACR